MSSLRQFFVVLGINLESLTQRAGPALTIVIGVGCAVGVLVSMLAMGAGARRQALSEVRADRVILTSTGAQSASASSISKDAADVVRDTPGIRKGANGQPIAVFEVLVMVEARKKTLGTRVNLPMYADTAELTSLRPELHITAGRMFVPGLHEIIASRACSRSYAGFGIGDIRPGLGRDWKIVGNFGQGENESCSLYADAGSVMSAFDRNSYNQVTVMLESADGFRAFQAALSRNPLLRVEAKRESEVVAQSTRQFTQVMDFASYVVGSIMALGATLGAVNSLFAIIDSRRREVATLRAIGFGTGAIIASTLAESILLALPGALLGAALAWLFFSGMSASSLGVGFQLAVTPELVALGVVWALVMGIISGIGPAVRAARLPVATELRAN